jgi:hypothetical protein
MGAKDRRPLVNSPVTTRIVQYADNRLGAVYSALYSFWTARHASVTAGPQATRARLDAYSVILFNDTATISVTNDFTSSPNQLLDAVLAHCCAGGTNFMKALQSAQTVMEQHFSTERYG